MGLIPREMRAVFPPPPEVPKNLTDLDALLERHGDDGTGYCRAACNLRGWQYPTGTCPTAQAASAVRDYLLAERRH
jgi:hypothetical protein